MKKIGFIGYGLRSETMLRAFSNIEADIQVAAAVDPQRERAEQRMEGNPYCADIRWYNSAEDMLNRTELDGVFIGTRCSLHTAYASMVLKEEIPLFLEKPVCISEAQYETLSRAAEGKTDRAVVSFPLRLSPIVSEVKRLVESGLLGKLMMVQAINNVPYGSVYYHSWYRDPSETGGLFLQKATHDIDYINFLTKELPAAAFAQTAKLHFRGDKPAGLHCPDCDEYRTCRESSYVVKNILKEDVQGDSCCFAVDTGNEDEASAIFTCANGVLISYNQIFTVKKSAARRGCRLIGTEASLEFDFYTGTIHVDRYFSPQTAGHQFHFPDGAHFGGDEMLALEFMNLMDGKKPVSDLRAGLASAAACLAAKKSAETNQKVLIHY